MRLALEISKVNMLKLQALWYLAFTVPFLWFLYWVCYEIIVWNKALVEVNLLNYVGLVLSLAFVFAGSQLKKIKNLLGISEKEKNEEQGNVNGNPSLIYAQQASAQRDKCSHHFGYLNQRSKGEEIPEECIICERLIGCMRAIH